MLRELIPSSPSAELTYGPGSRFLWVYYPQGLLRYLGTESAPRSDRLLKNRRFTFHQCMKGKGEFEGKKEREDAASNHGHSLFQEVFFFCTVKNVGDAPATGCIYVETVVDRDSGVAFAKVYPAKNAMNAVDILASRVVPFFERQGIAIEEIHTRNTSEYCGLPPAHPFETFLVSSHIEHLEMNNASQPYNYLCEQFYRVLLKEFFPLALRRTFHLSLGEMQKDLDAFVEAYNTKQMEHENELKSELHPSTNFLVDL